VAVRAILRDGSATLRVRSLRSISNQRFAAHTFVHRLLSILVRMAQAKVGDEEVRSFR
jgi:hypothetical protein